MNRCHLGAIATILISVLTPQQTTAESLGGFEYRHGCAICHGSSGKGDGPLAEFLTKPPSDLTTLQKRNDGVFPVMRIYATIEGSDDVKLHGSRDMPVWGRAFRARGWDDEDASFTAEQNKEYARVRILALIEYLSTIQAK